MGEEAVVAKGVLLERLLEDVLLDAEGHRPRQAPLLPWVAPQHPPQVLLRQHKHLWQRERVGSGEGGVGMGKSGCACVCVCTEQRTTCREQGTGCACVCVYGAADTAGVENRKGDASSV